MHPAAIGPFEIQRELGRGGMGEVFLARDTRLDRQVAIKALPAHLSGDPDRLARFQREAKVLASLNHPGIGAIYGLEESGGRQYLILEFVDGQTLAERLEEGPIPIAEALSIAKQIAEALEVAHEKGIVHRDLKPGNIMVNAEGAVKVLDFGLARTADGAPQSAGPGALANSPTVLSPTVPGVILGTAGYMSPEQARGKPVDKRSDIFSFGCILYEMLTGAMPFRGETVADAIGATLHKELDLSLLPAGTPPRVRELLQRCLAKERKQRLHDIADARLELEQAIAGHEWSAAASGSAPHSRSGSLAIRLAAALLLLAFGAGVSWLALKRQPTSEPQHSFYVSTTVPAQPAFDGLVAISPDARFLVIRALPELAPGSDKAPGVLMLRRLDRDETKIIDGTEGARAAALSPDGSAIAFACARDIVASKISLKKIGLVDGQPTGQPVTLCELPNAWSSLGWASNREIVIGTTGQQMSLSVVSAEGGEPRVVLSEKGGPTFQDWGALRPLPGGRAILATAVTLVEQSIKEQVEVIDLATGTRTVVLPNAGSAQYMPEGFLLATRNQSSVIAARFDPDALQIVGTPVTVLSSATLGIVEASASGTLAMVSRSAAASGRRLAWIDAQGQAVPISGKPRDYQSVSFSPDGGRVSVTLSGASQSELPSELWILDLGRSSFSRLPTKGVPLGAGIWTNDRQRITHAVMGSDGCSIWEQRVDGAGEAVKLYSMTGNPAFTVPLAWSPDGKVLAFIRGEFGSENGDIWLLQQGENSQDWVAKPYLESKANEGWLGFSPDGKWVQFISTQSGRNELYVQRFTGAGSGADDAKSGRVQVSSNGVGWDAWWGDDGKEIRYLDADGQLMSVQVQPGPSFSTSVPKPLCSIKELKLSGRAFAPDGRLLAVMQGQEEQRAKIDLVVNVLDEIRAKLAAAK